LLRKERTAQHTDPCSASSGHALVHHRRRVDELGRIAPRRWDVLVADNVRARVDVWIERGADRRDNKLHRLHCGERLAGAPERACSTTHARCPSPAKMIRSALAHGQPHVTTHSVPRHALIADPLEAAEAQVLAPAAVVAGVHIVDLAILEDDLVRRRPLGVRMRYDVRQQYRRRRVGVAQDARYLGALQLAVERILLLAIVAVGRCQLRARGL